MTLVVSEEIGDVIGLSTEGRLQLRLVIGVVEDAHVGAVCLLTKYRLGIGATVAAPGKAGAAYRNRLISNVVKVHDGLKAPQFRAHCYRKRCHGRE